MGSLKENVLFPILNYICRIRSTADFTAMDEWLTLLKKCTAPSAGEREAGASLTPYPHRKSPKVLASLSPFLALDGKQIPVGSLTPSLPIGGGPLHYGWLLWDFRHLHQTSPNIVRQHLMRESLYRYVHRSTFYFFYIYIYYMRYIFFFFLNNPPQKPPIHTQQNKEQNQEGSYTLEQNCSRIPQSQNGCWAPVQLPSRLPWYSGAKVTETELVLWLFKFTCQRTG